MLEYPSTESRYESASRADYETTSAVRSLCRYKKTPAYRLQLRNAILDSKLAELRATTHIEKKKIQLSGDVAKLELELLESGSEPSALSGHIALKPELSARLRQMF